MSVGVILVGFGYAGATLHAPLLHAVPGVHLAAVVSQQSQRVLAAYPRVPVFSTLAAALAGCDAPVVVLATPNDTHHDLATEALQARRHVVVDKPFTLTWAQACALREVARAVNRVVTVFHNRRWDADFLGLKHALAQGWLGRWTHIESYFDRYRPQVRARWRESAQPGSGLWYDLGPHLLDQALQLLEAPDAIAVDAARQRDGALSDDWVHAVLAYGERRVVLHASVLAMRPAPRWRVHGTAGTWEVRDFDPQEEQLKAGRVPDGPGWSWTTAPAVCTIATDGDSRTFEVELPRGDYRQFYAAMRDVWLGQPGARAPVTTNEACEVMRWLELGGRSAQQGRRMSADDLK